MPITKADAEQFFADYADALARRDAGSIAALWGVPGLVLSDEGAIAIADSDEVAAFFASSMDQYEGVSAAKADIVGTTQLSRDILACSIEWQHLNDAGETIGSEAGHYILKQGSDGVRIHVYTPKPA